MFWTNHEIARLKERYPRATLEELAVEFPRHSKDAIKAAAVRFGIHVPRRRASSLGQRAGQMARAYFRAQLEGWG